MTIDTKNLLSSILSSLSRIDYIKPDSIPNIDLYMDQITTFMDTQLAASKRYPDDKVLTKTMINNYAKNNLLPPPVKKKYSKEHILMLIFIYYFKGILSISDIESILKPLSEKYFASDDSFNLTSIYEEVFSLESDEVKHLMQDITKKYNTSQATFADAPEEEQEFLHTFSFICMLSFDVFVKRMLIEKLIDASKIQNSDSPQDKKNAQENTSEEKIPKEEPGSGSAKKQNA